MLNDAFEAAAFLVMMLILGLLLGFVMLDFIGFRGIPTEIVNPWGF